MLDNGIEGGYQVPYVYKIRQKSSGFEYVGSKYSKNCDSRTFWIDYFTHSKRAALLIEHFGKDDWEREILGHFKNKFDCLAFEREQIIKTKNQLGNLCLNIHTNFITEKEADFNEKRERQKQVASIHGLISSVTKTGMFKLNKEERLEVCRQGGYAAARVNKIRGTGIFDPEVQKRQHNTLREKQVSAFYDPETRHEISSKGGLSGRFSKNYRDKNNITEEEFKKEQSNRGKRGGPKNKGFRWYTDGEKDFKYTPKKQQYLCFDLFLEFNPQFTKGRK